MHTIDLVCMAYQREVPFLTADTNSILCNILAATVYPTHIFIIKFDEPWLLYMRMFLSLLGKPFRPIQRKHGSSVCSNCCHIVVTPSTNNDISVDQSIKKNLVPSS